MDLAFLPPHLAERSRLFRDKPTVHRGNFVLYWTHHALRTDENPALDVARLTAQKLDLPLLVYQGLSPHYRFASDRHHTFMLEGARDLQQQYRQLDISYEFSLQRHSRSDPRLKERTATAAVLVTEDFPLEPTMLWTNRLAECTTTPIILVDTACVLPSRRIGRAFDRAFEYRQATIGQYLDRIPRPWPRTDSQPKRFTGPIEAEFDLASVDLSELVAQCEIDHTVGPVHDTRGGSSAGMQRWAAFLKNGLKRYADRRNSAEIEGTSRMSAYLHYGMVSPMRLAREADAIGADKFLDELLIWRELAYTFCHYRPDVDSLDAIPGWARATLNAHANDPREAVYSFETTALARTGNEFWDACQRSLIKHGELHNNVRMTWGKAILDWTKSPAEALERIIDLNHRYALDGRDPASYGGILWCLGQFDRPFEPEQQIIGTVRPRPISEHRKRFRLEEYRRRIDGDLLTERPQVAVVGAGLAGLICARTLATHGCDVTVLDKSRGVGGRSACRRLERTDNEQVQFDHGAQYFTMRDPRHAKWIESWLQDGVVARWLGRIVELKDGQVVSDKSEECRYVGTPSMNAVARHLARELNVQSETKIARAERCTSSNSGEPATRLITDRGRSLGPFDTVIWNCPAAQLQDIFQSGSEPNWSSDLSRVEMTPCWALMLHFDDRVPVDFDGAFINDGPIGWMARNSSKPGRNSQQETWVVHSTAAWSVAHLEHSPEDAAAELLKAFTASLPNVGSLPNVCSFQAHRWRYAFPSRPLQVNCLWDDAIGWGACGDWCLGPRLENALLSGEAMAGRVLGSSVCLHDDLRCV